jgi:hypothetical protein
MNIILCEPWTVPRFPDANRIGVGRPQSPEPGNSLPLQAIYRRVSL